MKTTTYAPAKLGFWAWLKKLFTPLADQPKEKFLTGWAEHPFLQRQRREDLELPVGDRRWTGTRRYDQYRYWCSCGTELTDGPCGGAAVNAVCETCRLNYGCLPGYWGS